MDPVTLITFKDCPNAAPVRSALLLAAIPFNDVDQDTLEEHHALKNYTSPSILLGDQLIHGQKTDQGQPGCTFVAFDEKHVIETLRGKPLR
ncbi:MAG: hypothetical protein H7222_17535 [Methylotenera sp.]|nr:hypothetical protein [Oligoflexia bacterium]